MKILVSIATYGIKNMDYLNTIIDNYKSYKNYDIDIVVHGTHPLKRQDINFNKYENPKNTVYYHRKEFFEKQNQYDYFLFSEDDILIKEETIDTYIKYDNKLPINYCLGFIRFENTPEKIDYLIDLWTNVPGYYYIANNSTNIKNNNYFMTTNPFQSCYILSKEKLKYTIENSNYLISADNAITDIIETASAGIFTNWSTGTGVINKVITKNIEDLNNCFIHHMPNIHCNPPGIRKDWDYMGFRKNVITKQQLFNDLNLW